MAAPTPEFTLLMPCLDEAATLAGCLQAARAGAEALGLEAELLVADNGSQDGSVAIAQRLGARVVPVALRGYGSAVLGGIEAARGRYVMFADCDGSVDWSDLSGFVEAAREGADLVMGCRLPAGGGTILPGAMPWLHRWVGNPGLAWLGRWLFGTRVHDLNCGVRLVRRDRVLALGLRTAGMEFASEMLIKATLFGLEVREVPITLYPDGRARRPHARTFVDGWRHLRFMLMMSPLWLYLVPGALAAAAGALGFLRTGPDAVGPALAMLVGVQLLGFGLMARTFAAEEGLLPREPVLEELYPWINLEVGVLLGLGAGAAGLVAMVRWPCALALAVVAFGTQVVFTSFLLSMLGLERRRVLHSPPPKK